VGVNNHSQDELSRFRSNTVKIIAGYTASHVSQSCEKLKYSTESILLSKIFLPFCENRNVITVVRRALLGLKQGLGWVRLG